MKEDSDLTDTRTATEAMRAFVFKEIGEVDASTRSNERSGWWSRKRRGLSSP
jgi:hypothetical protein